jgi:hypothetical protein
MSEFYEVLYEDNYGAGLRFPSEVVLEAFKRFPPESEVGKDLWDKTIDCILQEGEEVPENRRYYQRIVETKEFCNGYVWLRLQNFDKQKESDITPSSTFSKYVTKDFKSYYFIRCNRYAWRANKEIISLVKEMEVDIPIYQVPKDYPYYIEEYDGMETVVVDFPSRQVIEDLMGIISKKEGGEVHPLTQRLLDGESLVELMNPLPVRRRR